MPGTALRRWNLGRRLLWGPCCLLCCAMAVQWLDVDTAERRETDLRALLLGLLCCLNKGWQKFSNRKIRNDIFLVPSVQAVMVLRISWHCKAVDSAAPPYRAGFYLFFRPTAGGGGLGTRVAGVECGVRGQRTLAVCACCRFLASKTSGNYMFSKLSFCLDFSRFRSADVVWCTTQVEANCGFYPPLHKTSTGGRITSFSCVECAPCV